VAVDIAIDNGRDCVQTRSAEFGTQNLNHANRGLGPLIYEIHLTLWPLVLITPDRKLVLFGFPFSLVDKSSRYV
jgi:hypothetical protein